MDLRNLKISTKLGLSAAVLIFLIFLLGVIGFYYLDQSGRSVDHIVNNNYGRIVVFKEVKDAVDTIDKALLSMALTRDNALKQHEKEKIEKARAAYGAAIKKIDTVMANVKDPKTRAEFQDLLDKIKAELTKGKEHNMRLVKFALVMTSMYSLSTRSSPSGPFHTLASFSSRMCAPKKGHPILRLMSCAIFSRSLLKKKPS